MDGMAIPDADGRYVLVNQAHADVYGYDHPDTFIDETWHGQANRSQPPIQPPH